MTNQNALSANIQTRGVTNVSTSLKVACGHVHCARAAFTIEQTPQGLVLVIRHKHDGEWHTSRYQYDFIARVLKAA